MSYFDELVAKYKNLQYGQLSSRNPSAVDNILQTQQGLLGNSLQFGNQKFIENIPTSEQEFINTPTGRVAQNRFRMGPDGNPIFGVPGQLNEDGSVGGAAFYDSSIDYGDPGYAGVLPVDPVTGLVTDQTVVRQGGGRDARNQSMTTENYNFAGGSFVGDTLNEDGTIKYGIHGYLPGGLLARGLTSPANQLKTLQSLSAQNMAYSGTPGNVTGAASDIAKLARDVQDRAEKAGDVETAVAAAKMSTGYYAGSRDTAQANMDAAAAEAEKNKNKFNLGDFIGGLLTGGDDKGDDQSDDSSSDPGTGVSGAGTDDTGGPDSQYGGGDGEGGAGGTGGSGASNGGVGGSGGCFVEGTAIQMADGSTKEITTIKVGEETKGGIVQAKMEFMPQNIYNYKDVLVSGSHWVVEDNQLIAVEDSKHGVLTDRIEPVYTFKTSDNRIWINDIEFGDFETGTDEDWEPHFEMIRQKLNKELRDGK